MSGRTWWLTFLAACMFSLQVVCCSAQDSATSEIPELLPKVTSITSDDATDRIDMTNRKPWSQVYEGPARFPWLGFDRDGSPIEEETLTIYEGMVVEVNEKGEFDLRFRVEAPLTQITLRMQLVIWDGDIRQGTITIPPIRIAPEPSNDPDSSSESFLVVYSGKSETLKRLICQKCAENLGSANCGSSLEKYGIRLVRGGTARFGGRPRN